MPQPSQHSLPVPNLRDRAAPLQDVMASAPLQDVMASHRRKLACAKALWPSKMSWPNGKFSGLLCTLCFATNKKAPVRYSMITVQVQCSAYGGHDGDRGRGLDCSRICTVVMLHCTTRRLPHRYRYHLMRTAVE